MKCKECESQNLKSTVREGISSVTALHSSPFYDEDGKYHLHSRNTRTTNYTCSNGHNWKTKSGCSCWCGWKISVS